jgi:hypothetical protein
LGLVPVSIQLSYISASTNTIKEIFSTDEQLGERFKAIGKGKTAKAASSS